MANRRERADEIRAKNNRNRRRRRKGRTGDGVDGEGNRQKIGTGEDGGGILRPDSLFPVGLFIYSSLLCFLLFFLYI